jgi:phage-related protein
VGLSIANVLLQITGDSDDARRELEAVSRDLALFGRETAEAEADIDTTAATSHLDELKARLAEFSADDHSTEVNVQIAKAQADLAVLQVELKRIDGENVKVDVDVRRGIVEKIASLTGQIERLGQETERVSSGGLQSLVSGLGDAWKEADIFGVSLSTIAQAGPAVVAVLVAVIGQIVAIVASAASAAGGLGALATSFVAALVPGILLAIGAIAQFKKDSETAGTAAFALSGNVTDLVNVFKKATAGGADAVFKGISDSIRDLAPLVQSLGPAFTRLGRAGGDAFRLLGAQFSSPAWRNFFIFTTDSLAKLTPLFARSFGAFAAILRNIATAAMPFLIQGFRLLAKGLEAIAGKTSDIRSLRDSIGGMVESLGAWGHLLGGIVKLAGAFVAAFAPIGDKIVGALGDGAENLAKWLSSSEGLRKIKQFFQDTGPLASELGKLLLNVGLALIQLGQFVAPALTPMVKGFNEVFGVLNKILSWLNDHVSPGFRALLGAIGPAVVGLGKFKLAGSAIAAVAGVLIGALAALGGAFGDVGKAIGAGFSSALSTVVSVARNIATAAVDSVQEKVNEATIAGRAIFNGVRAGFNAARGGALSIARAIAQAAVDAVRKRVSAARSAGQAIFNAVQGGFNAARGAVVAAARAIAQASVSAVRALVGAARGAGQAMMNAVQGGFNAARGAVVAAAKGAAQAAVNAVQAAVGAAAAAGRALASSVASGIRSAIGAVTSAASAIWNAAKSIIEAPLHIHIDVPDIKIPTPHFAAGVRGRSSSSVALVGEQGPELSFIPRGADVFTAGETRRILRALADGVARPIGGGGSAPALAGAGGGTVIGEQSFHFSTPGTGNPDPRVAMAQAALIQRQKGRRNR